MLLCAFMVAIISVLAQIAIPIGPVPFTMSIIGVYLTAGLLGRRLGAIAMIVYVLLGAFGVPIFTGAKGGLFVLAGPTGGFLWGYIVAVYLIGLIYRGDGDFGHSYLRFILASLTGLGVIYTLGAIQLKFVLGLGLSQALAIGVIPFVLFDLIKIFMATLFIIPVRRALKNENLLS